MYEIEKLCPGKTELLAFVYLLMFCPLCGHNEELVCLFMFYEFSYCCFFLKTKMIDFF